MSIVTVRSLTKAYKQGNDTIIAVNKASLDIYPGEFVTIVGKSGSGKSTLLNIIGCIDKPTEGIVTVDDIEITGAPTDELARIRRQKLGYVYQGFNLIPILTAKENIIMTLLLDEKKVDEAYFNEIVCLLGIENRLNHLPSELSGGQQQRVAIARALINKPAIMLADEPTGSLDKKSADEIMDLLLEVNKRGTTLLLVTHNEEYAKLANKRITIDGGELSM